MTQRVAIMILVLLVIGLLVYYVLKFKHWKQQRIHQDIEKKVKTVSYCSSSLGKG